MPQSTKNKFWSIPERTPEAEAARAEYLDRVCSGELSPKQAERLTGVSAANWSNWKWREAQRTKRKVAAKALEAAAEIIVERDAPKAEIIEAAAVAAAAPVGDVVNEDLKTLRGHVLEQVSLVIQHREGSKDALQGALCSITEGLQLAADKIRDNIRAGKATKVSSYQGSMSTHDIDMQPADYAAAAAALKSVAETLARLHGLPFDAVRLEALKGAGPQLHQHLHLHGTDVKPRIAPAPVGLPELDDDPLARQLDEQLKPWQAGLGKD